MGGGGGGEGKVAKFFNVSTVLKIRHFKHNSSSSSTRNCKIDTFFMYMVTSKLSGLTSSRGDSGESLFHLWNIYI